MLEGLWKDCGRLCYGSSAPQPREKGEQSGVEKSQWKVSVRAWKVSVELGRKRKRGEEERKRGSHPMREWTPPGRVRNLFTIDGSD